MRSHSTSRFSEQAREFTAQRTAEFLGFSMVLGAALLTVSLVSWSARDPSLNHATAADHVRNWLGAPGAVVADMLMQLVGFGAIALIVPMALQGLRLMRRRRIERAAFRFGLWLAGVLATAATASLLPPTDRWPLPTGLGGVVGDAILSVPRTIFAGAGIAIAAFGLSTAFVAILSVTGAAGVGLRNSAESLFDDDDDEDDRDRANDEDDAAGEPGVALISLGAVIHLALSLKAATARLAKRLFDRIKKPEQEPLSAILARVEPMVDEDDPPYAYAPARLRNDDQFDNR
ncbi:MAG: DNA translocase FtsK 4TM domain-containing protein, partial [Methylocystis sp.]|nr:DNA translocase FtsK 4TM domain-containing protein [Methylocystis sp.]